MFDRSALALGVAFAAAATGLARDAGADDALAKYRKSWNPFAAGPELVSSADLQPRGQLFLRPYLYSEFASGVYGDAWGRRGGLDQRLYAISPQIEFSYGILDWLEFEMYVPEASWWQLSGAGKPSDDASGFGDVTAFLKARFLVQHKETWWPSLTEVLFVALPTSDWFGDAGTRPIPGGFAPLGRLPSTHFGAPVLTEAILFRKNFKPFRISGGLYYSYTLPTSNKNVDQLYGDIFQYRLAFEHFIDDKHGFAYAFELVGIHGLPFRVDTQTVNTGKTSFGLIGVQPTLEYAFTDHIVGAIGCLFTAVGYNDVAAIYPNFSIYYYWNPRGKVLAR